MKLKIGFWCLEHKFWCLEHQNCCSKHPNRLLVFYEIEPLFPFPNITSRVPSPNLLILEIFNFLHLAGRNYISEFGPSSHAVGKIN